jgi:hypothetical protein
MQSVTDRKTDVSYLKSGATIWECLEGGPVKDASDAGREGSGLCTLGLAVQRINSRLRKW